MLCDHDDLRGMRRASAKKLLAQAKRETARRWLYERFSPDEMELELTGECDGDDYVVKFEEPLLKQRAIDSIDDVVSTAKSLRDSHATVADEVRPSAAHEATVAARVVFGYLKQSPSRFDCFDEDVRRQCLRIINEIYNDAEKSAVTVVRS